MTAAERWLEWLRDLGTYRPSDFLMFAPRNYWRLFELHNEAWWPLPVVLPGLGLAVLAWRWRAGTAAHGAGALGLAATGAFVAWSFVLGAYAPINWAATWVAALWAVLCVLLAALAASGKVHAVAPGLRRRLAALLAVWALLGQPLLAPLAGRPLAQAEVFGLAPDPTVLATLAWLLAGSVVARGPVVWAWRATWVMALACCLSSAATLALLGAWPESLLMAAAAGASGIAVAAGRREPGRAAAGSAD